MLTGPGILDARSRGEINIEPFHMRQLNPNSYDLTLGNQLKVYQLPGFAAETCLECDGKGEHPTITNSDCFACAGSGIANAALDPQYDNPTNDVVIPESGFVLEPLGLYLGSTVEYTETHYPWIPQLEGKSSLARLGLSIHSTAGFGDHGFCGQWTLELSVVEPVRIYPGMRICQICYHRAEGDPMPYKGKYAGQWGITPHKPDAEW